MRETSLVAFAALVLFWATPITADRPESGLRGGPSISSDLAFSAPSDPDSGPSLRRDVDEILEREKNEDDSQDPSSRPTAMDRLHGLIPIPRPIPHTPRDHASALRLVGLAAPLRC